MIKKLGFLTVNVMLVAVCVAIMFKCSIGVGAWDALGQSISSVVGIKIGTLSIILNSSCVLFQLVILKKEFKAIQLLQVAVAVILGTVVNFVYYDLFADIVLTNYVVRFGVFVLAIGTAAVAVGNVMNLNFITFPLEGLCMAVSQKFNKNFGKLRQLVDVLAIALVIVFFFTIEGELTVGVGTVVGAFIFGPIMDLSMNMLKPMVNRYSYVEEAS